MEMKKIGIYADYQLSSNTCTIKNKYCQFENSGDNFKIWKFIFLKQMLQIEKKEADSNKRKKFKDILEKVHSMKPQLNRLILRNRMSRQQQPANSLKNFDLTNLY